MPIRLTHLLGDLLGPVGYALTKAACHARNWRVPRQRLPAAVREEMQRHFPALDLDAVRVCANASLPPNWFARRPWAAGITLGRTIFLAGNDLGASSAARQLMMHELVHVEQGRRLGGEIAFARAYGRGVLEARGYRGNPLEEEAYEFVATRTRAFSQGSDPSPA